MRLKDKVAIVTGASRGQGEAEARLFVQEGARVVLADVLDGEGEAVAKELGDAACYVHLDVTDEQEWSAAVTETERRFGSVDVLVNNAGIVRYNRIVDTSLDEYMTVVRVNQVGVFLGMRAVIPPMKRGGGGSIVNISSVDGMIGMANLVSYVSSKFAVRGMTKAAAVELGRLGIRVNSVHPGAIDTAMSRPPGMEDFDPAPVYEALPLRRIGGPSEVARLVLFLASDESSYCTGAEFVVDGGMIAGPPLPLGGR